MNKKAQAVSIDIVIAVALFLLLLATLLTVSMNQNSAALEKIMLQDMQISGERTLKFLVNSPGETTESGTNWEEEAGIETVKFIGLAKRDRVLDKEKVTKFFEYLRSNYNDTKEKLLFDYDYYFIIRENDLDIVEEPEGTFMEGGMAPSDPYAVIILKRIVSYEGTNYNGEAIVEMHVFKEIFRETVS